jgi:AbrB family looped-hinge helix DNA binding protein
MNREWTKQKMYGTTLLGARGQLVIPANARKDLGLKPGDRLLVVGRLNKILGLVKTKDVESIIDMVMKKINSKDISKELKAKLIKNFKKNYEHLAKN